MKMTIPTKMVIRITKTTQYSCLLAENQRLKNIGDLNLTRIKHLNKC